MTKADFAMIGLGVMGGNLARNIVDQGFTLAVNNQSLERAQAFIAGAGAQGAGMIATGSAEELAGVLKTPRVIMMMVPAGEIVDRLIADLRPFLSAGDVIIDGGNTNIHDTIRRHANMPEGVYMLGVGVSGGAEGARFGPSMMVGGAVEAWSAARPVLEAISAKFKGDPCVDRMGPDAAGHFVKTVHNGIEYADMQMIAECYGLMRDGLGMDARAIGAVFEAWNGGILQSYLIEIAGEVGQAADPETGAPMLDVILGKAGQKGTGRWTAIEALNLGVAVPCIDAAVTARNLSSRLVDRQHGETVFGRPVRAEFTDDISIGDIEGALIAGKIMCYAQGFELIAAASANYKWDVPLPRVAEIWREGCIIRSALLDDMSRALGEDPARNLIFAPFFTDLVKTHEGALRRVVSAAAANGIAIPAIASALGYFDTMRTARGTANMLQGLRDRFGQHGFERTDREGTGFHGPWTLNLG